MVDMSFLLNKKKYNSRLIIGSGKYKNFEETKKALDASGAEIITVALKRTNLGQKKKQKNLILNQDCLKIIVSELMELE